MRKRSSTLGCHHRVFLHLFFFSLHLLSHFSTLSLENELYLVLIRLRLGLSLKIQLFTSKSMLQWPLECFRRLCLYAYPVLISWPERDIVIMQAKHASCFQGTLSKHRYIIDCTETLSKHRKTSVLDHLLLPFTKKTQHTQVFNWHHTFGTIGFLSECWGGGVSDKNLTQA